ncbi:hypothetical protein JA9_004958 [Meyerozyma sp. JA9]|nr:hypothetical protein JA9_004958 [Meyerozyma sp. JA9]
MKLLIFLICANLALTLNILLSTSDSWVTKNVRHLKAALEAENHTIVAIAPIYDDMRFQNFVGDKNLVSISMLYNAHSRAKRSAQSARAITDGGDFGHLLPVHQNYYKHLKAMNSATGKKPGHSVHKDDDPQESAESSDAFSQDPLDPTFWYINSVPASALLIGLDIILPQYYPDFKPDLVILGPQEGISYTPQGVSDHYESIQAMAVISASQNYPTITVSCEDRHHVYYQDEHFFNPQQNKHKRFKNNVFSRNICFTNTQIVNLVTKLKGKAGHAGLLPPQVALNVIIPSINHDYSHCATSANPKAKLNPQFKQVVFQINTPPSTLPRLLPKYRLTDNRIQKSYQLKSSGFEKSVNNKDEVVGRVIEEASEEQEFYEKGDSPTFVDKKSYYYLETLRNYAKHPWNVFYSDSNIKEFQRGGLDQLSDNDDLNSLLNNEDESAMLNNCHISVAVNHMTLGFGLGPEVFDVERLFMHNS